MKKLALLLVPLLIGMVFISGCIANKKADLDACNDPDSAFASKDLCISARAIDAKDLSACNYIKNNKDMQTCKAIITNNTRYCHKLSEIESIYCIEEVQWFN